MGPLTSRVLPLVAVAGLLVTFWQQYHLNLLDTLDRFVALPYFHTERVAAYSLPNAISRRVVAVADLHGDLQHAHNVLRMAGLIDNHYVPNWIGGHDVLVSTGDIVDRGDDTIELYRMFQRLRQQAADAGGEVRNCIGNHEMMNALVDWRYVTQGDLDSFDGAEARRYAMSTSGWIGQDWLANYSITHSIPLLVASHLPESLASSYSVPQANFVHGGIHPSWAALGVEHINDVGRDLLYKALDNSAPNGWLPPGVSEEEMEFYGESGPLWNRHYATADERSVCEQAKQATGHLAVRHIVMGHTPHLSGFVVRCSSSVLLIDTGISKAYGGEQSALVFDVQLRPLGKGTWEEEEVISALYRGRKPRVIERRTTAIHEQ